MGMWVMVMGGKIDEVGKCMGTGGEKGGETGGETGEETGGETIVEKQNQCGETKPV